MGGEIVNKKTGLNTAQRDELRALLLARQRELAAQMEQNEANLAPPTSDDASPNSREVDQALTDLDLDEIARVERALRDIDGEHYGLCDECGCQIPFERLRIEPQTSHCVACKSRWEQKVAAGLAPR